LTPVALTIAGSDPSGGAGIQADLKTFHQFGVYGEAVLTLLTVQNTREVTRVEVFPPSLVVEQLRAAIEDIPPAAAKTGALGSADVDPVMVSKQGAPLIAESARDAIRDLLMPVTTLVTPNLHEAAALTGMAVEDLPGMRSAAQRLVQMGCRAALVKGGHLKGPAVDLLLEGTTFHEFASPRVDTPHTHGTGCTYSAAITAELAKGTPLPEAVMRAKEFITRAIRTSPGLGGGSGPVNHFA
jgi:hydroxymethylpyrimidine/phosphomethylpyrimidine kinase